MIDVAVKSVRQLFNAKDPSPFRDRDLDDDFADYVVSSAREFSLKTPMKINIVVSEESSQAVQEADVVEAVRSHFNYQAEMTRALIRKRFTVGRFFLLIGLAVLFTCLGVAQFFELQLGRSQVGAIFQEGLVIVGWVAMWRPVELMLYDWWPLREEMQYYQKIAALPVEIRSAHL